jgi:hypothetical protein
MVWPKTYILLTEDTRMLRRHFFEENAPSLESADETIEQRIDAMAKLKDVNDKSFNAVNWQIAMDHIVQKSDKASAKTLVGLLTKGMTDTLEKAVTEGSLADSDLPSAEQRDRLIDLGLMSLVSEKGKKMNAVSMVGFKFWDLAGGDTAAKDDKDDGD